MTSLVTGATGFLGQHLVASLLTDGEEVIALEHARKFWPLAGVGEFPIVCGDVRDLEFLRAVISRYEVDTVYHLAAQTQVTTAYGNPADTFDVNVRGTWTVLEACRLERVRRVVVASSDKVYGECDRVQEDFEYTDGHIELVSMPLNPQCHYSVSKAMTDQLAYAYARNHGMPVAIARCGNLYGPGDTNWKRLIPGAIRAALRKEPYVLRTDGSGVRDYIYINDAVAAYRMLALSEHVGPFNFSGGEPSTATAVLYAIDRKVGNLGAGALWEVGTDATELKHQTLCCDKAAKLLGWKPSIGMDQGLNQTIEWYRSNI